MEREHPALTRLRADRRLHDGLDALDALSPADLVSFQLELAARRADDRRPADVLDQYGRDRFVAPGEVDAAGVTRVAATCLDAGSTVFEPVVLAPTVPLGTHHVLGGVAQNNVVSTTRGSEVAADPTVGLALEVAVRRRDVLAGSPTAADRVALSAVQRITRAQRFDGPRSFAHFSLYALVIGGRAGPSGSFERETLTSVVSTLVDALGTVLPDPIWVAFSDFDGVFGSALDATADAVSSDRVNAGLDPDRAAGRGYYPSVCFKLGIERDGERIDLGDGGAVPWTQLLLANKKERLMTGALSLDRVALLTRS